MPNSVRLVTGVGRPPLPGDVASILAHENSAEYDWLLENAAVIVERERERRNREDRQLLDVRYLIASPRAQGALDVLLLGGFLAWPQKS